MEPPGVELQALLLSLAIVGFFVYFLWDIAKALLKVALVIFVIYICSQADIKLMEPLAKSQEKFLQLFRQVLWPRFRTWADEL
jgi:hypothetical protein